MTKRAPARNQVTTGKGNRTSLVPKGLVGSPPREFGIIGRGGDDPGECGSQNNVPQWPDGELQIQTLILVHEEVVMRIFMGLLTALFLLAMTPAGFAASDIPDLKGTWIIQTSAISLLKSSQSPIPKLHMEKLGIHEGEFLMVIEQQDGYRFSGYRKSDRKKESVSGVIGYDHKEVYMVDDDGMIIAKLVSPDKIEAIYLHVTKQHSVAAREIMTRKR